MGLNNQDTPSVERMHCVPVPVIHPIGTNSAAPWDQRQIGAIWVQCEDWSGQRQRRRGDPGQPLPLSLSPSFQQVRRPLRSTPANFEVRFAVTLRYIRRRGPLWESWKLRLSVRTVDKTKLRAKKLVHCSVAFVKYDNFVRNEEMHIQKIYISKK